MSEQHESVNVKSESKMKPKKDWYSLVIIMLSPVVLLGVSITVGMGGHPITGAILTFLSIILGAIMFIADNDDSVWAWNIIPPKNSQ